MQQITKVIFRKFKDTGHVLALFPDNAVYPNGDCESYMHIGQHSGANYNHCIDITVKASPDEYKALYDELLAIGYALEVKQRHVRKRIGV